MYTLKGVFPEPKKEPKRNFIKENVRQLKLIQGKATEPKFILKPGRATHAVGSPPSNIRSSHSTLQNAKSAKKIPVEKIRKGDMAEFLHRKQLSQHRLEQTKELPMSSESSQPSTSRLRHTAVQTLESSIRGDKDKKRSGDGDKSRMSGDGGRSSSATRRTHRGDDLDIFESRSKLTAILDQSNKDPYLPSGYQKGVVPKYIRSRKDKEADRREGELMEEGACPPGHVLLPDAERKETLRMLRNSFGELVSEMNKMPVKSDTLKMRTRKIELEKQLSKLEEGIKLFSRPKVYVKIE